MSGRLRQVLGLVLGLGLGYAPALASACTSSANLTQITTVGPTFTDPNCNVWSLMNGGSNGNQVAINGTIDTVDFSAQVANLAFVSGEIWQYNGTSWWRRTLVSGAWLPASGAAVGPNLSVAAPTSNYQIVAISGYSIFDANGNYWTLTTGAQVAVNGTTDTTTGGVTNLEYNLGRIYQVNTSGYWYSKALPTDTWSPPGGNSQAPVFSSIWNLQGGSGGVATSGAAQTATSQIAGGAGVTTTTCKVTGKFCAAILQSAVTSSLAIGVGNSLQALAGSPGSSGSHSVGIYTQQGTGNQILQNGTIISSGSSVPGAGTSTVIELDSTAGVVSFKNPAMSGWNNSSSANPETGAGAIALSGASPAIPGPYFVIFNTQDNASAEMFNPLPGVLCTASFGSWDPPSTTGGPNTVALQ